MRNELPHSGQKHTPREKPDKMGAQPKPEWHGVVVRRVAGPDCTFEMFIDKVRPEKSVRTQAGEDVPWRRNGEEDQAARKRLQFTPAGPAVGRDDEQSKDGH